MRTLAIAHNTAREALRSKVLYSIVGFAALVAAVGGLFGSASLGNQMKFVKDFSLFAISLFGVVIAVTIGVGMLHKELGKRTILNILSKPISRAEFLLGKFLGLLATLVLVVGMMDLVLVGVIGVFEGRFDPGLLAAGVSVLLELVIVVAVAVFFSAVVVTPTLAGLFTVGTFIAGRCAGYLSFFQDEAHGAVVHASARLLYWILPHLDRLVITDQVVYGDTIPLAYLALAGVYAIAYATVTLALAVLVFERREFV